MRGGAHLGPDVNVILTRPCMFCVEHHSWNTQGGVRMSVTPTAECAAKEELAPYASPELECSMSQMSPMEI